MIQQVLSNREGTLDRGVTFSWTCEGDDRVVGLVFDLLLDRYFFYNKTTLLTEVQEIARLVGCRPAEIVRAFSCLSGIRLESNHITERLMTIEEAAVSEEGAISVTIRLGGWLTYQLHQICLRDAVLPC
ncbi:hypothetical protein [Exiguobacterium sp. s22]|uniref:hypothetical protein n=1 Tax=Exiguobacterium sp. s22 TaxID=2751272 RepID=UPI001BE562D3|nr:hypothetical protein [Exiguobacterium sp. s22]